jgi:hypothetical protein
LNFFAAVFFLAGFLTAMNSPDVLSRLVQAVGATEFVFKLSALFHGAFSCAVAHGFVHSHRVLLFRFNTNAQPK